MEQVSVEWLSYPSGGRSPVWVQNCWRKCVARQGENSTSPISTRSVIQGGGRRGRPTATLQDDSALAGPAAQACLSAVPSTSVSFQGRSRCPRGPSHTLLCNIFYSFPLKKSQMYTRMSFDKYRHTRVPVIRYNYRIFSLPRKVPSCLCQNTAIPSADRAILHQPCQS